MTPNTPKSKLTDWFPPHVKPVRDGVYRVYPGIIRPLYARFRDGQWLMAGSSVQAARVRKHASGHQQKHWCGLAHDPATIVK